MMTKNTRPIQVLKFNLKEDLQAMAKLWIFRLRTHQNPLQRSGMAAIPKTHFLIPEAVRF